MTTDEKKKLRKVLIIIALIVGLIISVYVYFILAAGYALAELTRRMLGA